MNIRLLSALDRAEDSRTPPPISVSHDGPMKFSEIASRLTGFSTPLFGLQWDPPTSDVSVAHEVVSFLEDRRVLYTAIEVELPEHCVTSVLEIRMFLTGLIGAGGIAHELEASLRGMRAACRKFLDDMGSGGRYRGSSLGPPTGRVLNVPASWADSHSETAPARAEPVAGWPAPVPAAWNGIADLYLNQAIGELRGVIGIHVAQLAVRYGLDIEDDLASILPTPDDN
jgi:hypothetical protein